MQRLACCLALFQTLNATRAKCGASRVAFWPSKRRACGEQRADNLRFVPLADTGGNQQPTEDNLAVRVCLACAFARAVKQRLRVGNLLLWGAAVHAHLFLHSVATCQGRLLFFGLAFDWLGGRSTREGRASSRMTEAKRREQSAS